MALRHLALSYHTCPIDEPGIHLSGGMNVFLRALLPQLQRHGVETEVWSWGLEDTCTSLAPGVTLRRVACGARLPWTREQAFACLPEFLRRAPSVAGFEAVSAHYWMSGLAARALAPPRPWVMAFHSLQALKGHAPDPLGRAPAEEELARQAYGTVFFSALDERVSRRHISPPRSRVIAPGIERRLARPGRAAFGLPEEDLVFLLAARDEPAKNLPLAAEAVEAVPGAWLAVAGQTQPDRGRIRFLGSLPQARMAELYASVDAILVPSDYESFGLVVLEALAAGKPVAVTDTGYWGRVLKATGAGLVSSPSGFPAAVARLADEPELRLLLGEAGSRLAQRFTWSRSARKWAAFLLDAARSCLPVPGERPPESIARGDAS